MKEFVSGKKIESENEDFDWGIGVRFGFWGFERKEKWG